MCTKIIAGGKMKVWVKISEKRSVRGYLGKS